MVQITGDGFRVEVGALQNTLENPAPHLQLMLSPLCRNSGYAGHRLIDTWLASPLNVSGLEQTFRFLRSKVM